MGSELENGPSDGGVHTYYPDGTNPGWDIGGSYGVVT